MLAWWGNLVAMHANVWCVGVGRCRAKPATGEERLAEVGNGLFQWPCFWDCVVPFFVSAISFMV